MPLLRTIFLFFLFSFLSGTLFGQSIKGSWYGVGHIQMDGNTEHYLSELILKQDGKIIKGEFNYYFRDSLFKNNINCTYDQKTRLLVIKSFPIIYYRSISTKQSVMVNMMGTFELRVAKTGSVINGSLTSSSERTLLMPVINYRLIKDTVVTVQAKTIANKNNSINTQDHSEIPSAITADTAANKKTSKLTANSKSTIKSTSPTKVGKANSKQQKNAVTSLAIVAKDTVAQHNNKNKIDSVKHQNNKSKIDTISPNISKNKTDTSIHGSSTQIDSIQQNKAAPLTVIPNAKIAEEAFIARKKDYARIIEVDNSKIRLEVYDNGTIDYDSVSLFLNNKLILPKTMLNHHSVKLTIELDESLEFNELGMFAENLGLIPPNTAALIIHDGKKTYEITLNSDFSKNAIVQLKKKKGIKKD